MQSNKEGVELLIKLFRRALEGARPELGFPKKVNQVRGVVVVLVVAVVVIVVLVVLANSD